MSVSIKMVSHNEIVLRNQGDCSVPAVASVDPRFKHEPSPGLYPRSNSSHLI